MIQYSHLAGRRRRRHRRLLRHVIAHGVTYVRTEPEFRMVERLHRIGLVTACVSKYAWAGGPRPFRELAVFASPVDARRLYASCLPRH